MYKQDATKPLGKEAVMVALREVFSTMIPAVGY